MRFYSRARKDQPSLKLAPPLKLAPSLKLQRTRSAYEDGWHCAKEKRRNRFLFL